MEILFSHMSDELQTGYIQCRSYTNGNLAVQLILDDDEPYAELSISTDIDLPKDEFVAKTYNENEGLLEQFLENGIFSDTGKTTNFVGWSTPCPIYQLLLALTPLPSPATEG
tara:strand:- start:251 stop:586 length:336 start_codon:yes stop_codon:yes gene_type:complete